MPWVDDGSLWVGHHKTHGLIVFPRNANEVEEFVTVFYVAEDRFASVSRKIMRQYTTGKSVTPAEAQRAAQAYHSFPARQRQKELENKNRAFLERLGKASAGTRPRAIERQPRVTHCYACHERLDSNISFECIACEWLLCECGACGCGYAP